MKDEPKLLEIKGLKTFFFTHDGVIKAVDDLNIEIKPGEILGLVGESGSGKSVSALSILRLIPEPPGRIVGGEILFQDENLLNFTAVRMRKEIRGRKISMIFQDPMTSLNPVFRVSNQIAEALWHHLSITKDNAFERAIALMDLVGIPMPRKMSKAYPHQFSGGMRQRIMIAIALACQPALIIADEPTTALDVTIQAQILELMENLRREFGSSILLITHDLGVVAEMADRVAVMYAGNIVESGDASVIFDEPRHPYTRGLINCLVNPEAEKKRAFATISGMIPDLINLPSGCAFLPRCPIAIDPCGQMVPENHLVSPGHMVKCHLLSH